MPSRLKAIGQVYGAEITHIAPRSFRDVKAKLAGTSALNSVIICSQFAPHINIEAAVPNAIPREMIHSCASFSREDLEEQVCSWVEIAVSTIENEAKGQADDENKRLLQVMLRGMLSHSKIGQFSHCQKATVLTGVRARHLNAAVAERILSENSESFQDTRSSSALFLWKEHNDGRQYFLNPQEVERAKLLVANMPTE
jgi:hypothetical protein